MNLPTLSIIIPAYNAENTIKKLVDSIYNQKSHNISFEIIIVNDGSTDRTKNIIENLLISRKEIISFDTENQGVSSSRNTALDKVQGKFIWMLDSDDIIENHAFSTIETYLDDELEVLHFGYKEILPNGEIKEKEVKEFHNYIDGFDFLKNNDGRLYLWTNIYSKYLLDKNNVRFIDRLLNLEDSLFNIQVLILSKKVKCISEYLYVYQYNENSITNKNNLPQLLKKLDSSFIVHKNLKIIRDKQIDKKKYDILDTKLSHTELGFFYSLISERYPLKSIKEYYDKYLNEKLLPITNYKASIFLSTFNFVVNNRFLFIFLCKLNLFFRGEVKKA